jgi:hypothetical protein
MAATMPRFTYSTLALLAATLVPAAAAAQPAVRDHRSAPPPAQPAQVRDHRAQTAAAPAPEVRDHRSDTSVRTTTRYRRRPGPRVMMPLKIDLGATGANTYRGFAPGIGAAIGIHWASLSPRPTNTDVGIGVFGALMNAPRDMALPMADDNTTVAHGGAYLEVGQTLSRGSFWRTWASGRGEYLGSSAFDRTHAGFGGTARLSAELYLSGAGIEPRGVFLGTYAIGVYAEAGLRDTVADTGKFHAGMGLTFRTPLVFAP